jgi:hypothetical protein
MHHKLHHKFYLWSNTQHVHGSHEKPCCQIQKFLPTRSQQTCSNTVTVLHCSVNVGRVHLIGHKQFLISFFQCVYTHTYMNLFFGFHVICNTLYEYKHLHSYHTVLCSLQVQSFCLPKISSLHNIIHEQKCFPISMLKPLNKIFMLY